MSIGSSGNASRFTLLKGIVATTAGDYQLAGTIADRTPYPSSQWRKMMKGAMAHRVAVEQGRHGGNWGADQPVLADPQCLAHRWTAYNKPQGSFIAAQCLVHLMWHNICVSQMSHRWIGSSGASSTNLVEPQTPVDAM